MTKEEIEKIIRHNWPGIAAHQIFKQIEQQANQLRLNAERNQFLDRENKELKGKLEHESYKTLDGYEALVKDLRTRNKELREALEPFWNVHLAAAHPNSRKCYCDRWTLVSKALSRAKAEDAQLRSIEHQAKGFNQP